MNDINLELWDRSIRIKEQFVKWNLSLVQQRSLLPKLVRLQKTAGSSSAKSFTADRGKGENCLDEEQVKKADA
jgi:hypothetical protein